MHKLEKLILESYIDLLNEQDKDQESFDLQKDFEDNPSTIAWRDIPDAIKAKFSKEIEVYGKKAPGDPKRDYVNKDYGTYYFTTSYNKETGSVGHRLIKLPSYAKLYSNFAKIVGDIKTLMGVDSVRNDSDARELFDNTKTLFRQLQRYLRTEHPEQYKLMKMRRMYEGVKKSMGILENKFGIKEGEGDDHHYLKVSRRDYKKAQSILDQNIDSTYVKMEIVDNDGAGNVIFYFIFRNEDGFDHYYDPEGEDREEFYDEPDVDGGAFVYDAVMDLQAQDIEVVDHSAEDLNEKMDVNDPVMLKVRRAKMHSDQMKKLDAYIKSPKGRAASRAQASAERKEIKAREIVRKLKIKRAQVMSDMENDPKIEPTGGPLSDMYGDQLNKIDNAIEKAASLYNKNMSYDQAVGKVNEFVGDAWVKRNEPLYDKLVKGSGKSDTVEGEILRAVNRIIYRWGNDGDYFWKGYGAETAGPAISYLVNSSMIPQIIQSKFKAWESNNDGEDYDIKELEDLLAIALEYIEGKDESQYSKNTEDMFDYESEYEDEEEDDDYDNYDDYDDEYDEFDNEEQYQEGKISLAESLLDEVEEDPKPEEKGDKDAPKETVLEDATDTILSKFPTLKAALIKLQTEDFKEFVNSIDWISPRPTEFRINLMNGQDYILKWTGRSFEAQIMGKRYFIDKIDDYQQALDKLAILYKEGPMSGAGEGEAPDTDSGSSGGGGGDFPGGDASTGGDDSADFGDDTAADDAGGADLTDEPVDFEEPAEEPEA